MKTAPIIALGIALAIALCSCSSQSAVTASSQASLTISQTTSVDEKTEIMTFINSAQVTELVDYITSSISDCIELVNSGNSTELNNRFDKMASLIEAFEAAEIPESCKDLAYNLQQSGRCAVVALGDFSAAANSVSVGDKSAAAKSLNDASDYVEKATEFLNSYTKELQAHF